MSCSTTSRTYYGYRHYQHYHRTMRKNREIFCETILTKKYIELSNNSLFKEIKDTQIKGNYLDIDMDEFSIIDSSTGSLATTGAATCFVICVKGKNTIGKSFIGLYHSSHFNSLKTVISLLNKRMTKKGCLQKSLEFFILGGRIVSDDPDSNSIENMQEALKLAKKLNIMGVIFNHSLKSSSGFQVLLTANKIFYSTKYFFNSF